jgi:hypothetical protein
VDQTKTTAALWVRVLPGSHNIRVVVQDGQVTGNSVVALPNAQAGHVYEVRLNDMGKTYSILFDDLGKRDSYTKRVGLNHFNATDFVARF